MKTALISGASGQDGAYQAGCYPGNGQSRPKKIYIGAKITGIIFSGL
jgi:GDP-D-mannose dehydratase